MLNQVILVGKVVGITNKSVTIYVGANESTGVPHQKLHIELSENLAENTMEYCKEGSTIGIKAHLENAYPTTKIVAEKLTFINTKEEEA